MKNVFSEYLSQEYATILDFLESPKSFLKSEMSLMKRTKSGRLVLVLPALWLLHVLSLVVLLVSWLILLVACTLDTALIIFVLFGRTTKTLSRSFSRMREF